MPLEYGDHGESEDERDRAARDVRALCFLATYEQGLTFRQLASLEGVTTERARQIVRGAVRRRRMNDYIHGGDVSPFADYWEEARERSRSARARKVASSGDHP